jgi:tRNA-(ms[2]io[6]A)-hydroxylase
MAGGDGKRHLPVLQSKQDEDEERPPWQWSVIGAVAIVIAWLPLAMLAGWAAKRTHARYVPGGDEEAVRGAIAAMTPGQRLWLGVLVVIVPLLALAFASFAGGLLVGRFGGRAGKREAAVAGLAAAAVSALLSLPGMLAEPGGMMVWLVSAAFLLGLATVAAYWGGALGIRAR